jgi:S-formylglutathione hydrolase FrmB
MAEQVTHPAVRLISVGKRLAAACLLAVCLVCAPSAGAATFHDGGGLHVVAVKQLDARLFALSVATKALPAPANVYVLLPPDYDSQPDRHWPVFYLLHGTSGGASDWVVQGGAEKVIGDRELITVMPDIALNDDGGGWCTDWPSGAEKWETFHISQLIPWVDSNLRTIAGRQGRAIAGLSQGGFCSLSYAARHPDLFTSAFSYSGLPDIAYGPGALARFAPALNGIEVRLDHVAPNTIFGDPASNAINWAAHDPATLAGNLRGMNVG